VWADTHLQTSFNIFPMVRYTGHAFLSPLKTNSDVLLDDKITGATTAPSANFPCESTSAWSLPSCQDWFSLMILLGGPGVQGTNEEVSPDTSRC